MNEITCTALLLLLVYYATTCQLAESKDDGSMKDSSNANGIFVEPVEYSQPEETYGRNKRQAYNVIPLENDEIVGTKKINGQSVLRDAKHVYNGRLPATEVTLKAYASGLKAAVGPTDKIHLWVNPTVYGPGVAIDPPYNKLFYIIEGHAHKVISDPIEMKNKNFVYNKVEDLGFQSAFIRFKPVKFSHLKTDTTGPWAMLPYSRVN